MGKEENLKTWIADLLLVSTPMRIFCAVRLLSIPSLEGLTESAECLKQSQQTTVSSREVGAILKPPAPATCVQSLQI